MPTPSTREFLARLESLAAASASLDPGPEERGRLLAAVHALAESYNEGLFTSRAFTRREDDGREIGEYPVREESYDLDAILELFQRHIHELGVNAGHGAMMAYIPSGHLYHSALADFLAANANPFTAHSHASPGGVRMENELIRWMAKLCGLPASFGGNLTSGGSLATLSAFVAAREAAGVKARDVEKTVVYASDQVHHAVGKGLKIAGLGECVMRSVPLDDAWRMEPRALAERIAEDRRAGLRPWLVVANAGATNTGMIDPLAEIGEIARREKLWYHVDAAYGGFFLLTAEGRERLAGIETADSIILDAHKSLFVPFGTGAVLVRDARHLQQAFGFAGGYAQDALARISEPSPALMSPELTRHFRGFRLWFPLMTLGVAPFRAALEEKLLLARYAWERLRELPGIETGPEPDLTVVVFRFAPGAAAGSPLGRSDAALDDLNGQFIERVLDRGREYISSTRLEDRFVLRIVVLSNRTHRAAVDGVIESIREFAGERNSGD